MMRNVPTFRTGISERRKSGSRPSRRRASGRNLKLEIEYDGTNYCGWQVQSRNKHKPSIQGTLEKALQKILQERIKLTASGRTDAGVHAKAQVANFQTKSDIALTKLQQALNGNLPKDISISRISRVSCAFHSRFDAKSKVYRYTILNRRHPSAILRHMVYFYPYPLDVKLMREEAKTLAGRHDFSAFKGSNSPIEDSVRKIKKIRVARLKDLVHIEIEAQGFLYNMARNIAGTLLEIGRGRFGRGALKKILKSGDRRLAGPTLPAHGLCLVRVKY